MAETFPTATLELLQYRDRYVHPRVEIQGKVVYKRGQGDGDTHIIIAPTTVDSSIDTLTMLQALGLPFVICEEIPEIPLPTIPVLHTVVNIRGIFRWDIEHGWPEIHPVLSWDLVA